MEFWAEEVLLRKSARAIRKEIQILEENIERGLVFVDDAIVGKLEMLKQQYTTVSEKLARALDSATC